MLLKNTTYQVNSQHTDVCIIGGGIIGLFSAYYLQKEGYSVTILDKGPKERASSHANCGMISPSHILPLNSPSLILKSIKWLFEKDAPFYIQPRIDLNLWSWLLKFTFNATHKNRMKNLAARHLVCNSSRELYHQIMKEEDLECNWRPDGYLFLYKTEKAFEAFRQENDFLKDFGYTAKSYQGADLQAFEPAVREDIHGAWFQPLDGWLKPDELVTAVEKVIIKNGATIINDCEVVSFEGNGHIKSVKTDDGKAFSAKHFILAGGAMTPLLKKSTKLNIPIVPAKGYSITMKSPSIMPKYPLKMAERKVVATPFENSFRLGSTLEFVGYDTSLNRRRIEALKSGASEYIKEAYTDEIYEEWSGWRPMTPDAVPIIDRSPVHKNLWLACGHNMLGVTMAPATGKLISALVANKETHIDAKPFGFSRF